MGSYARSGAFNRGNFSTSAIRFAELSRVTELEYSRGLQVGNRLLVITSAQYRAASCEE